jgi:hypothetical protein
MLRTASASALRNSVVRAARPSTSALGCRAATTHAISNPTLANIEKRWEHLPMQEQADLWMALRDRMKENWADLTVQEKKAGEWNWFSTRSWPARAQLHIASAAQASKTPLATRRN